MRKWFRMTVMETDMDLRQIEQRAGEVMPGWDNRGVPGTRHYPPEQPQKGFADGELLRIDPGWRPM